MPDIGEIKRARELGKSSGKGSSQFIWHACEMCGKERWVLYVEKKPLYEFCQKCAVRRANTGEGNPMWKGGKRRRNDGYILIKLKPGDFFFSMADKDKYVLEHRLVMAKSLGRCLQTWELVHHRNHIRFDNRIENLQIILADKHYQLTILESRVYRLEQEVTDQKKEIRLLKWQLQQKVLV